MPINWSISGWRKITNQRKAYSSDIFENNSREDAIQPTLSAENPITDTKLLLETEEKIKSLTIETVNKEPVGIKTGTKAINETENHVKSCHAFLIERLLNNLKKTSASNSEDDDNSKKPTKLSSYILKTKNKTNACRKQIIVDCCTSLNSSNKENSSLSKSESVSALNQPTATKSGHVENLKELTNFFKIKSKQWEVYSKNLVDSHCHFDLIFFKIKFTKSINEYFEEYQGIYLKNLEYCINVNCDPYKFSTAINLNRTLKRFKHPKVFSTLGCHPHFADRWTESLENLILNALKDSEIHKIVAIGECGLDSSRKNFVDMKQQIRAFKSQLRIANKLKIPIVIHCRDNDTEVFELIQEFLDYKHPIHVHCFTGGWDIASKFLDAFENLCIGVTPLIDYCSQVKELVENIPLNRLLLETDSPYFFPTELSKFIPTKANTSHPAYVYYTAECVAKCKKVSINEVINSNRANINRVYSI